MSTRTFSNLPPEKQRRILDAALAEFAAKGYAAASINAVVQQLGIAKGSIFQYFHDKEGLFIAVFSDCLETAKDWLRTIRDTSADAGLFQRLSRILSAGVAFTRTHPDIYRVYTHMMMEPGMPMRIQLLGEIRKEATKFLTELLEAARKQGELRQDLSIPEAVFLIEAVMDRFLQARIHPHLDTGLFFEETPDLSARITALIGVMETGMAEKGQPS